MTDRDNNKPECGECKAFHGSDTCLNPIIHLMSDEDFDAAYPDRDIFHPSDKAGW
jgi:hypothetical protein